LPYFWHIQNFIVSIDTMPLNEHLFFTSNNVLIFYSLTHNLKEHDHVYIFGAAWAIVQLSGSCRGCKNRPMLSTHDFKQRGATPTATWDLGLYGLIRRADTNVPQWDLKPLRTCICESPSYMYWTGCDRLVVALSISIPEVVSLSPARADIVKPKTLK
jgi:hypothetical protein